MRNELTRTTSLDMGIREHYTSNGHALNLTGHTFRSPDELLEFSASVEFGKIFDDVEPISYSAVFNNSKESDKSIIKEMVDFCQNDTGMIVLKLDRNREKDDRSIVDNTIYLVLGKYKFSDYGFTSFLRGEDGVITGEGAAGESKISLKFKINVKE